ETGPVASGGVRTQACPARARPPMTSRSMPSSDTVAARAFDSFQLHLIRDTVRGSAARPARDVARCSPRHRVVRTSMGLGFILPVNRANPHRDQEDLSRDVHL